MAGLAWLLAVSSAEAADIVLSPEGKISTPAAARDAARSAGKPVRVIVANGTYFLDEPLALDGRDSGVTWEAAEGAAPVFTGGRRIAGWTEAGDGHWRASVPEAKERGWNFAQLWVDGRRATRARTPNRGYFHLSDRCAPGVFPGVEGLDHRAFTLSPEHYEILRAIPEGERGDVLLTVTHAWSVAQCRIESLADDFGAVLIRGRSRYPFVTREKDQRFWISNYRGALDEPGEWFLDRSEGAVFYRPLPGEDLGKAEVIAPVTGRFLEITGARGITFRGIRFRYEQDLYPEDGLHDGQAAPLTGGAIEVGDSSGIRFEDCEVAHTGRHGIYFRNGCSDCTVTRCRLHDLGGGGVRIGETSRPDRERLCRGIVVDDCIIQHGGRLHPSACGVTLTHAQGCRIVHCDIGDFFYTGVSFGWNWGYGESLSRENRLENCHIHHLGWAYLSDMGGFYNLGNAPGTVVRGNHVHHVASHSYGGWGLYTDEGSGDVLFENNLVHDTSEAGFHQHYGYANRIRNNIFAFGEEAQVQRSRNEGRLTFVYENNIVAWDASSNLLSRDESSWKPLEKPERGEPRDSAIFRNNLYWRADGKRPEHLAEGSITWEEWRSWGRDHGSLFADPGFVDVGARDFRLRPESPAFGLGFREWDLERAGVRGEGERGRRWRELAAEGHDYPEWETRAKPWPAPEYRIELQTFEGVPVGGLGIRGAEWKRQGKGESVGVTDLVSSPLPVKGEGESKRSLRVKDMPGLEQPYDPVLDVFPPWDTGEIRATFDVMAEEGADWFFEIRGKGGEFAAGPYVRWQGGRLVANNADPVPLADVAPGEWIRVSLVAATGSGRWELTVTRADGPVLEFPDLPCRESWDDAGYLLWSGIGTAEAAFYIDNLVLERDVSGEGR